MKLDPITKIILEGMFVTGAKDIEEQLNVKLPYDYYKWQQGNRFAQTKYMDVIIRGYEPGWEEEVKWNYRLYLPKLVISYTLELRNTDGFNKNFIYIGIAKDDFSLALETKSGKIYTYDMKGDGPVMDKHGYKGKLAAKSWTSLLENGDLLYGYQLIRK